MQKAGAGGVAGESVRGIARRFWRGVAAAKWALFLVAWTAGPAGAAVAHDAAGPLRIPLAPMGYQAIVPEFMLAGGSALTVHFVDKDHLLITFAVRRLMKREVGDPPNDEDRTIAAFLVELPSGKVLAQTEWRLHDRSQYLWSLGRGRFLLRVHDRLTTFSPLGSADPSDAFRQVPLLRIDRHIIAILVSFDGNLVTVESTKFGMGTGEASEGFSVDPSPVQVNFYRLTSSSGPSEDLQVNSAGAVRARTAVALPLTTAGFLDVLQGGKDRWLFNFDEHAGKVNELAEWDTTCAPRPTFVGHSEFVAFGCRGSDDRLDFAGFNLKGEEMWQQNFLDLHVNPTFSFAPAAGRFALGRTIVSSLFDNEGPFPTSLISAQEVRVYQSYNGKQVLKIECSPVERAGQNFALSDDGLRLAAVRETIVRHPSTKDTDAYTAREATVEVYPLPPLTKEDRAAVDAAEAGAPADSGARIDLALRRLSKATEAERADTAAGTTAASGASKDGKADTQAAATPDASTEKETAAEAKSGVGGAGAGSDTSTASAAGSGAAVEGDPVPAPAPRKPPTLYGPDEKPAGKQPR